MTATEPVVDYSAYQDRPDGAALAELFVLADRLEEARRVLEQREAAVRDAKKEVEELEERRIPELAERLGSFEFRTPSGRTLKVEDAVHASITEANADDAYDWLERNGHGGLIKRQVVVAFPREQQEEADALVEELGTRFENIKRKLDVHSSTLRSWVTRRLKAGEEIPPSITFYQRKEAKLS